MTQTVLLALDTSTEFCSVALLSAADIAVSQSSNEPRVWSRHENTGAVSSTRLLPAIRELFAEARLQLSDCSAIAFGSGPGSFTGLRTATGVAQGLAFGLNLPVVPVSTLLVCAESARRRDPSVKRVLAALDARMDEAYWADFAWDDAAGDWRTVRDASLDAPGDLTLPDEPFTLAGNAAAAFGERLPAVAGARSVDHDALPHAVPLAYAALRALLAGRTVPADQAAPVYVRNKVAQTTAERMADKANKAAQAAQSGHSEQSARSAESAQSTKSAQSTQSAQAGRTVESAQTAQTAQTAQAGRAAKSAQTTDAIAGAAPTSQAKPAARADEPTGAPRAGQTDAHAHHGEGEQ